MMLRLSRYFSSAQGEVFALAMPKLRQQVGAIPFERHSATFGIGGNTFRAYRGWSRPPSSVYREWASDTCAELDTRLLASHIETIEGFRDWHASLAKSLHVYWKAQQRGSLSFAHQHKLIDLFVKWLSRHNFDCPQLTSALVSHGNCALDSQTLGKLNECLSFALPLTKPSMGDIRSKHTYDFCQELIDAFVRQYDGTRLLFDYFAWRHGGGG